jgi:hypothetical protein
LLAQQLHRQENPSSSSTTSTTPTPTFTYNGNGGQTGAPWPKEAHWVESQHKSGPKQCGSFHPCNKGSTYFSCQAMNDHTAHGILPVPLPGQTIHIHRMPTVRKRNKETKEFQHVSNPKLPMKYPEGWQATADPLHWICVSTTQEYVPFTMPTFQGVCRILELGRSPAGRSAVAYVLRNFDGVHGQKIAEKLASSFGRDVLRGSGTQAKCAAALGNNCQDKYDKIYPPRMFLDAAKGNMMKGLLDAALHATNAHLRQTGSGAPPLSMQQGSRPGEMMIGESQILRFKSVKQNRMHVHLDCPGSRWVAITSLGDTGKFVFDNARNCNRCYIQGNNRGGTGDNAIHAKKWHTVNCPNCTPVDLRSGDVLLFYGHPNALVAHGSMGTIPNTCPASLPDWAKKCRISCQYRLTDHAERTKAFGGHTFGV